MMGIDEPIWLNWQPRDSHPFPLLSAQLSSRSGRQNREPCWFKSGARRCQIERIACKMPKICIRLFGARQKTSKNSRRLKNGAARPGQQNSQEELDLSITFAFWPAPISPARQLRRVAGFYAKIFKQGSPSLSVGRSGRPWWR